MSNKKEILLDIGICFGVLAVCFWLTFASYQAGKTPGEKPEEVTAVTEAVTESEYEPMTVTADSEPPLEFELAHKTTTVETTTSSEETTSVEDEMVCTESYIEAPPFSYDDLTLLACVIECEAGSDYMSDLHRLYVASVVINRVADPDYPDTIYDVVYDPGQYACTYWDDFEYIIPSDRSYALANHILTNGSMLPSNVIYQAEFTQGSGVFEKFETCESTTYFCYK